jgi:hypothetical protein
MVMVAYINYRLEQKLVDIQIKQQNILTKVYSLERQTELVHQTVRQTLQKQQLSPQKKSNFLLTSNNQSKNKNNEQNMESIN